MSNITAAPTFLPTAAVTANATAVNTTAVVATYAPTFLPTASPTTAMPSAAPTTAAPSFAPTDSNHTLAVQSWWNADVVLDKYSRADGLLFAILAFILFAFTIMAISPHLLVLWNRSLDWCFPSRVVKRKKREIDSLLYTKRTNRVIEEESAEDTPLLV